MRKTKSNLLYSILPRLLLAIVAGWNLLCAFQFIFQPNTYISAFDLSGESSRAVVQSVGVLFLMWNVPYLLAILQPNRWKILIFCALLMQAIGCIGEIWIRFHLPESPAFRDSLMRFALFDVTGFFLLLLAFLLVNRERSYTHVASTD